MGIFKDNQLNFNRVILVVHKPSSPQNILLINALRLQGTKKGTKDPVLVPFLLQEIKGDQVKKLWRIQVKHIF